MLVSGLRRPGPRAATLLSAREPATGVTRRQQLGLRALSSWAMRARRLVEVDDVVQRRKHKM